MDFDCLYFGILLEREIESYLTIIHDEHLSCLGCLKIRLLFNVKKWCKPKSDISSFVYGIY